MTLRGSVADFPLETIVQLLAATGKTGHLEVRADREAGSLGFDRGRLVSAVIGEDSGDAALGAVFTMTNGQFEFVSWEDAPHANLAGDLSALLDRAVVQRDRIVNDRALIPHDGVRFALSGRAADQGEVRLSASQWKVLLAVNGQRDLRQIASEVGQGPLSMLSALAELVRSGIVEVREAPPEPPPSREPPPSPEPPAEPEPPRTGGEDEVHAGRAEEQVTPERYAPEATLAAEEEAPAESEAIEETPATDADSRDERLAALSGIFAAERGAAWAPPVTEAPREEEARGPIEDLAAPAEPAPAEAAPAPVAWPATATPAPVVEEPRKRGGLFGGLFKKEATAAEASAATPAPGRVLVLGALANALLDEYAKPEYGKGRLDDRIANLLMRVDEQADPIDHAIPVTGDRLDLAALLQRKDVSDRQVAPYLALLVSQIYEDAERAFGKDKAKRGYRAAVSSVAGADTLGSDLRLPRA